MPADECHPGCLQPLSSRARCSIHKDCRRELCKPNGRSTYIHSYAHAHIYSYTHTYFDTHTRTYAHQFALSASRLA
jgi:hypothetical protein